MSLTGLFVDAKLKEGVYLDSLAGREIQVSSNGSQRYGKVSYLFRSSTYTGMLKDFNAEGWGLLSKGPEEQQIDKNGFFKDGKFLGMGTVHDASTSIDKRIHCSYADRTDQSRPCATRFETDSYLYEGTSVNTERHGMGKCTYTDGSIYIGQWKTDLRCGLGKLVLKDGSAFVGRFSEDVGWQLIKCDSVSEGEGEEGEEPTEDEDLPSSPRPFVLHFSGDFYGV